MSEHRRTSSRPSVDDGLAWLESVKEPTEAQLTAMRVLRNMAGLPFMSRDADIARAAALPIRTHTPPGHVNWDAGHPALTAGMLQEIEIPDEDAEHEYAM